MQPGKLIGCNRTHISEMGKLIKQDYTPQEISDKIKVNLTSVLSHYQMITGKSNEEMAKYSKVDKTNAGTMEAQSLAANIIANAEKEAARIKSEALVDVPETKAEVPDSSEPPEAEKDEKPAPSKEKSSRRTAKSFS